MAKKRFLLSLLLLGVLIFRTTGKASADASTELERAETLARKAEYEQAQQIYQQIVTDYPGTDAAFAAQRSLPCIYITMDQQAEAQAAFNKLLADFSEHERMPHAIHEIAERCGTLGRCDQAKQLYQYVLDNQPGSAQAIWLQMGIGISSVYLGDDIPAELALARLITEFSGDDRVAETVGQTAWAYRKLRRHEKARPLYQFVVDNWPDNERAIFSQRGLVLCNIALGDDANAEAAIEKLLTQFSGHNYLPTALYGVARELHLKNDERAAELYQYIVGNHPAHDLALSAQLKIANIELRAGDQARALAIYDKVFADLASDPLLPRAVALIADGYYEKAILEENHGRDEQATQCYRQAIAEADRIITQLPETLYTTAEAHHLSATCFSRLGEHAQAIEYYQKIVDNWPAYKYTWSAQFLIGYCYEQLRDAGAIPKSEADPHIKVAYEQVLEYYPNCPAAKAARDWLKHNVKSGEGE